MKLFSYVLNCEKPTAVEVDKHRCYGSVASQVHIYISLMCLFSENIQKKKSRTRVQRTRGDQPDVEMGHKTIIMAHVEREIPRLWWPKLGFHSMGQMNVNSIPYQVLVYQQIRFSDLNPGLIFEVQYLVHCGENPLSNNTSIFESISVSRVLHLYCPFRLRLSD